MSASLRPAVGCGRPFPEEQRRPKFTSYIIPTSHPAERMSALELSRQSFHMNRWYSWKRVFQWRFPKNLLLLCLICLAHIGYRSKIFSSMGIWNRRLRTSKRASNKMPTHQLGRTLLPQFFHKPHLSSSAPPSSFVK